MSTIPRLIAGRSDEKDVFAIVNALVDGLSTGGRVFVETVTGVGPWNFTGLDGDEDGLIGYELELSIVDPVGSVYVLLNGDVGPNYGDYTGVAANQVTVAPWAGATPGAARGVVEIRGVATGNPRSIDATRVMAFETVTPSVSGGGRGGCWTMPAKLTDVSVTMLGGAAAATSAVSLFKVMSGA